MVSAERPEWKWKRQTGQATGYNFLCIFLLVYESCLCCSRVSREEGSRKTRELEMEIAYCIKFIDILEIFEIFCNILQTFLQYI